MEAFVSTSIRIIMVTLSFLFGGVGNGTILYIYAKDKQLAARTFILILAAVDLYSSLVLMPQFPLIGAGLLGYEITVPQMVFVQMTYMLVTVTMALDRVFAVFTPFKYAVNRRRLLRCMAGLASVILPFVSFGSLYIIYSERNLMTQLISTAYLFVYSVGLVIVALAYPAISVKLYRQHRKINPGNISNAAPANQAPAAVNAAAMTSKAKQKAERALHVKTLKLYVAILCLFLANFVSVLLTIWISQWLSYLRLINFCGNAPVYYILVDKFRSEVNRLMKKFSSRLQT